MTEQFAASGITGALASWQLYAAMAAGITVGWLVQNAYHAGRLAASQPGITLADPAVSTAWGIVLFGEQVRGGLFLALTLVPLILLTGGMFLLSRSPALQGHRQRITRGSLRRQRQHLRCQRQGGQLVTRPRLSSYRARVSAAAVWARASGVAP